MTIQIFGGTATTKITGIKLLSFVPYQDVVDKDIMWVLRRNEVKIEGRRTVSFDPFNQKNVSQAQTVFGDLTEEMYAFCNDSCKGIWTYTYTTEYQDTHNSAYFHGLHEALMTGTMHVYFELREDRDAFMKNHILLAKLAQE